MPASPADRQPAVWVVRAVWLVQPLLVGPVLGEALETRSVAVQTVVTVAAWAVWGVVLVALLVPRATSLTVARVGIPAAGVAAVWAATEVEGGGSAWVALAAATVAFGAVLSPTVADVFVDGSSYGAERRFALRLPVPFAALAVVTWVAVAVGVAAGPLLLAAEVWVLGAVAVVVGAAVAYAGARSLHGLSRRWLVIVPSGLVVHDPLARPDSVMAPRPLIVRLGPAEEGSDALDLTLGAGGLVLELETSEPLPVTVRRPGRDLGTEPATRVLIAVARPAAVLDEAAARTLPVA